MSNSPNEISHSNTGQGSIKSYIMGFTISAILTIIPFVIVMNGITSHSVTVFIIISCAVVQALVQLFYFLHLNTSLEDRWNLVALVFSGVVIGILVIGSLWIMYNLNTNMVIS